VTRRACLALSAIVLTSLTLAGCSSPTPDATAAPVAPTGGATPTSPSPTVSEEPEAAGDPTCETIIPTSMTDDFTSLGWTVSVEPFRIGTIELDGGIQCKWGDQKVTTDRVQLFGWAPIDEADAAKAEKELVAAGWRREYDTSGTYISENPSWVGGRGDADGYGITYLFGDGWVKVADTRQSLILVNGPS